MFVTISLLMTAVCLLPAVGKLLGQPKMRQSAVHFGIPWPRYRLIGVAELAAAAGILIGLWWHPLGVAAAAGMTLLLLGALITHRRAADSGKETAPALSRPRHHHRLPGHRPHQLGVTRPTAASGWFPGTHHGPFGSIAFYPERTPVLAAGSHPADLTSSASSDAMSSDTASIRARWVNACGKFPRCSPVVGSISSA